MQKALSSSLSKAAALLMAVCITLAVVVVSAYFGVFGPLSGYSLAKNDSAWSAFGSYLGGVLGPLFAFFAFVGVLLTVWLQGAQLDSMRSQAGLEEMQRVISNVSANIDVILAQGAKRHVDHPKLHDAPITIFTLIAAAGSGALSLPSSDYVIQASQEKLISVATEVAATEIAAIGLELDQLSWCLTQYRDQSGSPTVLSFYKRRYDAIVCWLDALELLNNHHQAQEFFEPKVTRKYLLPIKK